MLREQLQSWFESGDSGSFDALAARYSLSEVLHTLMALRPSYPDQGAAAERLAGAECLRPVPRPIRTVGTFYYRAHTGGAEHVISQLAAMWASAGQNIVNAQEIIPHIH